MQTIPFNFSPCGCRYIAQCCRDDVLFHRPVTGEMWSANVLDPKAERGLAELAGMIHGANCPRKEMADGQADAIH